MIDFAFAWLLLWTSVGLLVTPPPVPLSVVEAEVAIARDPLAAADVLLRDLERLTQVPSPPPPKPLTGRQ
jgi:hypothetical protein